MSSKIIILLFTIILLFFSSCLEETQNGKKNDNLYEQTLYRVDKIDSINNYYLIYASKEDTSYKIISKKKQTKSGIKIQVKGIYDFRLNSMLSDEFSYCAGIVSFIMLDSGTKISVIDTVYKFRSSSNIEGLYFLGHEEKSLR
jgi:hypothetical protein